MTSTNQNKSIKMIHDEKINEIQRYQDEKLLIIDKINRIDFLLHQTKKCHLCNNKEITISSNDFYLSQCNNVVCRDCIDKNLPLCDVCGKKIKTSSIDSLPIYISSCGHVFCKSCIGITDCASLSGESQKYFKVKLPSKKKENEFIKHQTNSYSRIGCFIKNCEAISLIIKPIELYFICNSNTCSNGYTIPQITDKKDDFCHVNKTIHFWEKRYNDIRLFDYNINFELNSEFINLTKHVKKIDSMLNDYYIDNVQLLTNIFELQDELSNNSNGNGNLVDFTFDGHFKTEKSKIVDDSNEYYEMMNEYYRKNECNANEFALGSQYGDIKKCEKCDGEINLDVNMGMVTCIDCGYTLQEIGTHNMAILTHKEKQEFNNTYQYTYKKLQHFTDHLKNVMGIPDKVIPQNVIDKVKNHIYKDRVNLNKIDAEYIKKLLKQLKLTEYYETRYYILYQVSNIKPLKIPISIKEELKKMFCTILEPYEIHCKSIIKSRKNFMSYPYVLYQFCKILKLDCYLKYFPLLKNRDKLYLQDEIWKKICNDPNVNFPFYPTV